MITLRFCLQIQKKAYEIAIEHAKVANENIFINKEGVRDDDLRNKIRKSIRRNQDLAKEFLLGHQNELHLEFEVKRNTRKRSGNVCNNLILTPN